MFQSWGSYNVVTWWRKGEVFSDKKKLSEFQAYKNINWEDLTLLYIVQVQILQLRFSIIQIVSIYLRIKYFNS